MSEYEHAKGSLSKKSHNEEEPSGRKEFHARKLDHGYHVTKKHPDGSETEHAADDLDEVHDHMHDHFMEPEGEEPAGEEPMPMQQESEPSQSTPEE